MIVIIPVMAMPAIIFIPQTNVVAYIIELSPTYGGRNLFSSSLRKKQYIFPICGITKRTYTLLKEMHFRPVWR